MFPCPCCGYETLEECPPGTYDICPICYWEDDQVQYADPAYEGGANLVSLHQAQANFVAFGASELPRKTHVRPPCPADRRDPNWRPRAEAGA